jgi:hypothetical protein
MIGASVLSAQDNNTFFFEDPLPDGVCCPQCGTCLDYAYAPRKLSYGPLRRYDVSYTYDGRLILSARAVDKLGLRDRPEEIHLVELEHNPSVYYAMPTRVIAFDPAARQTRFEEPCACCDSFESVVGATPAYLKGNGLPGRGFFRTDLAFASGREKTPLVLMDDETAKTISQARLSGRVMLRAIFPTAVGSDERDA